MDARHFDALARTVTEIGTRRGLLALLATLPLLGGLFALLDPDEVGAKGRRKRRKKRHKHGKGRRRGKNKKKQKCKAKSRARICANRCGIIKNKQTCKKKVNCGPCACDPLCPICQTCNETTGVCQPDASQQGDDCGEPGQVCQADGTCACDASSCAQGQHCQDEVCVCDSSSCSGCCAGDTCQPGTADDACGSGGAACTPCTGTGNTCGGSGQGGVCGCTPTTCADEGKDCGAIEDGCGGMDDCGTCPSPYQPCDDNVCGPCVPDCTGKACGTDNDGCGGPCLSGTCDPPDTCGGGDPGTPGLCGCTPSTCPDGADCGTIENVCGGQISCGGDSCGGATPICVDNICTDCSAEHLCASGCCSGGMCVADCPSCHSCVNGVCAPCPVCCNGTCCDGCCDGSGTCGPCLVFLTSIPHDGNLGGLNGADALCQHLADNATTPLPGAYKAWLSGGAGPGDSPANGRFHRSAQPYQLVDGTTVADNWDGLTSGSLNAAISRDESGAEVSPPPPPALPFIYVWTNTTPAGIQSAQDRSCNGWLSGTDEYQGRVGRSDNFTFAGWTQGGVGDCSNADPHLYCFQQD